MKGKLPRGPMRMQVRRLVRPYTVYRQTETSDDETLGAPASSDYTELSQTRDVYLYDEREARSRELEGSVVDGNLSGVALASTDIQVGDRVDYGSHRYEVETVVEQPPNDPAWLELSLDRV